MVTAPLLDNNFHDFTIWMMQEDVEQNPQLLFIGDIVRNLCLPRLKSRQITHNDVLAIQAVISKRVRNLYHREAIEIATKVLASLMLE